jgi:hypothetical protein
VVLVGFRGFRALNFRGKDDSAVSARAYMLVRFTSLRALGRYSPNAVFGCNSFHQAVIGRVLLDIPTEGL